MQTSKLFTLQSLKDSLFEAVLEAQLQVQANFPQSSKVQLAKLILNFDVKRRFGDQFEFANSSSAQTISAQYIHYVDGENALKIFENRRE